MNKTTVANLPNIGEHKSMKYYITTLLVHLIAISMIFILPEFMMHYASPDKQINRSISIYAMPIACILVFYLNYFWLINKFLFTKRISYYIILNIILVAVMCVVLYYIHEIDKGAFVEGPPPVPMFDDANHVKDVGNMPPPHFKHHPRIHSSMFMVRDAITAVLTIGLSIAVKMTTKWAENEKHRQTEMAEMREAELKNLKNQLNPHFLFNTLNNIYSLTFISTERAQTAILNLSNLLRYVLYDNNNKYVPVDKEIEFVHHYIDLMRLRLGRNVEVTIDIDDDACNGSLIAPLMFVSMIENAFKHGVAGSQKSFINISLQEDKPGYIKCEVANSYFPKGESDKSGSGIGMVNLQRQLTLLYPDAHTFEYSHDNTTYTTTLIINLNSNNNEN